MRFLLFSLELLHSCFIKNIAVKIQTRWNNSSKQSPSQKQQFWSNILFHEYSRSWNGKYWLILQQHEPHTYHIPNLIVQNHQFRWVSDRQLNVLALLWVCTFLFNLIWAGRWFRLDFYWMWNLPSDFAVPRFSKSFLLVTSSVVLPPINTKCFHRYF